MIIIEIGWITMTVRNTTIHFNMWNNNRPTTLHGTCFQIKVYQ